ncbi:cation:proton antiporter [Halobacteriales archaeon QS_1_68_17]|nr:MAG: cation:proton antiporter [Halobacteriales archaeon QS_1_68_17]
MSESYAVLLVAVPILGSIVPLAGSLWHDRLGWPVAVGVSLAHLALAAGLAVEVFAAGTVVYELGGFEPPFGIVLVVDGISALVALLVGVVSAGVLAYARRAGPRGNSFYSLYLLLLAGLSGMTVTGDAFNLYVFLEITGLAAYALVATGDHGGAAVAALKYLIIGTVGASLYLLGVGYAFVATGTLNMADLAEKLAAVGYTSPLVLASFALVTVGFAVKVALFPLHTWQPDAYAEAPISVSVLISALVSTVAAYALARLVLSVYTVEFFAAVPTARTMLVGAAAISVVAGSVLAVSQTDIQRMLAYSSVSQFGLIVAAVGIANRAALVGAVVHLVGHAVMKGGLFATAGVVERTTGARSVDEYAGLAERAPLAAGCFAVLALAMVGVPPAVGFVGKWYIVVGAVEAQRWAVAAVLVVSTLLTLAYFARLVERMYFTEPAVDVGEPAGGVPTVPDGGRSVSTGMVAVVVAATVLAATLGFAASGIEALLEPTLAALGVI